MTRRLSRWLKPLVRRTTPAPRTFKSSLRLEELEPRQVPATIIVNDTGDTVAVDGKITLREAIESINTGANVNADINVAGYGTNDTVDFGIGGAGVKLIEPANSLTLSRKVVINGYSQNGASANTKALDAGNDAALMIEIRAKTGVANGFVVSASDCTVRGLSIVRFVAAGVRIEAAVQNTVVAGNFIGVSPAGVGGIGTNNNGVGVRVLGTNNLVGGTAAADRNVISGNGIGVEFANNAGGNKLQGSYVGTSVDGLTSIANTAAFATAVPPINSTTTWICGSATAARQSVEIASRGNPGGRSLEMSQTTTRRTAIGLPARDAMRSHWLVSNSTPPPSTVPQPSIAMFNDSLMSDGIPTDARGGERRKSGLTIAAATVD